MYHIKMKSLLTVAAAIMLFTAVPAEAQNNSGNSKSSLSVRRERQSAFGTKSKAKKEDNAKQKNDEAKKADAKNTDVKKADKSAATTKATTAPAAKPAVSAAKDTTKNATRPRFVPRQAKSTANTTKTSDDRAQNEFPVAPEMPSDVSWRRDIYRSLDLMDDANATLYYPLEAQGDQINLFTYLLKLILRGHVKAYDYSLNGNENFSASNQVKAKDILDRYHIYYETKDGKMHINDNDIPAAEVTEYFLKESSYFDQRTATYHTRVTALCPVLKRADDFGGAEAKYPMFWVKYSDISTFLTKLPLTGSNYNNAATMSADDYFAMNRYKGKIYKTNNLQGKVLANYCTTDSALVKEQKKIEKQLTDFESHIWGNDSTADSAKVKTDTVSAKNVKRTRTLSSRRSSSAKTVKEKKVKTSSSASSGSARVSVRRERH